MTLISMDLSSLLSSRPSSTPTRLKDSLRILLPEVLLHEIADSSRGPSQAVCNANELKHFCISNLGRVLVGKDSSKLIREQKDIGHRLHAGACINHISSRFLNSPHIIQDHNWVAVLQSVKNKGNQNIKARKSFLHTIAPAFQTFLDQRDPNWLSRVRASQGCDRNRLLKEEANQPQLLEGFLKLLLQNDAPGSKYLRKPWITHLPLNPDSYALGIIAKLMIWYSALYAADERRDYENATEDMQYIFLATYTGNLATQDKGMARAAKTLWPYVNIVPTSELFDTNNMI